MKRFISVVTIGLVIGVGAGWFAGGVTHTSSGRLMSLIPGWDARAVTIMFTGDIMLSRNIGSLVDEHGPRFPFRRIASTTRRADLAVGNLENPVSVRGGRRREMYAFRATPRSLDGLTFAGFDVVTLANNHIGDYGPRAMRDTFSHLDERGISYTGAGGSRARADRAVMREAGGRTIAFLGATSLASPGYTRAGAEPAVAALDPERLTDGIAEVRERGADRVVVLLHWGTEYETEPAPRQRRIARRLIDAGADAVIGHHPHVVQPVERYKGGVIAYSLGNFIFDQNFRNTKTGLILEVAFREDETEITKHPVRFTQQYQPYLADDTM